MLWEARGMQMHKDRELAATSTKQQVVKVLSIIEIHQNPHPVSLAVSRSAKESECHKHKLFA